MKVFKIAVIDGDGIGPEVVKEGVRILKCFEQEVGSFRFAFTYFPWGCDYYQKTGRMMDEDGLEQLSQFDAIYLGAVGSPSVPDHISLWDLLLKIRKGFDQYVNLRPIKLLKQAPSPLKGYGKGDIDIVVIRENVEGEYAGEGNRLFQGKPEEVVLQTGVFSRKGTERVIRYAFKLARKEKKKLTSVSKANALNYSMVFWDQIFDEIAREYPDVATNSVLVDAACMFLVKDPSRFEIIVTSNLFGDIITDLGASIAGGMGMAAGANLNPDGDFPPMFEPVHGSAPDIAGKGIANPMAALWSVSQMLDYFGYEQYGAYVLEAIERVLAKGVSVTPDLGGEASTEQVGAAVEHELKSILQARACGSMQESSFH